MSSIHGVVLKEGKNISPKLTKDLSDESAWWNPDTTFEYLNNNVLISQQNLHAHSQVLLESQNIFRHPSNLKIVSDARIDNRAPLLKELKLSEETSNSQLIVELYSKYGYDTPSKLIGAFSFIIWDPLEKVLFCARDQMGVKPLNYYATADLFIVATQKKSILYFDEVEKSPNWRNIFNSISGMGIPPNSTQFQNIFLLPPAHYLTYKNGEIQISRYWELDTSKRITYKSEQDYIDRFKEIFSLAIEDRMDALGTLGAHLSGGLDSSGISGFTHELAKKKRSDILYFSYNVEKKHFKNQKILQENALAFDFIKYHNIDKQFVNVHKPIQRTYAEMVENEALFCDGFSTTNNVNTEFEMQHAAKAHHTKVILSGFPGDELVTSFCRPYYLEYFNRGQWFKYFTKEMNSRHGNKEKFRAFGGAILSALNENITTKLGAYYYYKKGANRNYAGTSTYLNKEYFLENAQRSKYSQMKTYPMVHDGFPKSLRVYQKNHVCRPHTSKRIESENLSALAFGLEYRYPMTDIRVLQYMLSIPMEEKISTDMSRKTFRLATKGHIPDSIRLRDDKNSGSLKAMLHIYDKKYGRSPWDLWAKYETAKCAPFLNPKAIKMLFKDREKNPVGIIRFMILAQLGYEKKMDF